MEATERLSDSNIGPVEWYIVLMKFVDETPSSAVVYGDTESLEEQT